MFNFTDFLKGFDSKKRWIQRIDNYVKKRQNNWKEFERGSKYYSCSVEAGIEFVKNENIDDIIKYKILNELLERKNLELKNEIIKKDFKTKSLDSEHFNMYEVKNMNQLAEKIILNIKEVRPEQIKYLFQDYVYCFTYKYNYNSIKTNVMKIRTAIKESDILTKEEKDEALDCFKCSMRVHRWLGKDSIKIKKENMERVLEPLKMDFLYTFTKDSLDILDMKITKTNMKEILSKICVALALATGRRRIELMELSTFEKISKYKIRIIGLGKKRDKTENEQTIEVPTLFLTADEVLKLHKKLHEIIPRGLKSTEAKEDFAKRILDSFKDIDSRLWSDSNKFTNLRAIYAVACEELYNQKNINQDNKRPQPSYFRMVLGHDDGDFGTWQHYFKRQILIKDFDVDGYLNKSKSAMM